MIAHLMLIGGRSVFVLTQGSLGVEVFIFISGFLMTMILAEETELTARGVSQFYIRRFFRIAPLFYLAVVLYVGLRPVFTSGLQAAEAFFHTPFHIAGLNDVITWRSIGLNLLFGHGLFPDESGRVFGPAWSLSLEMQFYLAAPFCIWFFRRWPALTMTALFSTNYIANQLFGVYGRTGWIANFGYPSFLPNRIFLFAVGGSYYAYLQRRRTKDLVVFVASAAALLPLVGVKCWLVCLLLIGFLHAAISATGPWRAFWLRVAESMPTQLIAEWSYGIYLFHMLCIALVAHLMVKLWSTGLSALVFTAFAGSVAICAVLLSALLHYAVERPARDFGKRLTQRSTRAKARVPVATLSLL